MATVRGSAMFVAAVFTLLIAGTATSATISGDGASSTAPAALGSFSVADLAWMSGCWASVGGETGSGEQWTDPAGGTMLGVSRTVVDGKTVAHEFLLIRDTEDGQIEFVARPLGQAEAVFVLVMASETVAVFENPEHDFPQRIVYRPDESEGLAARIEGEVGGVSQAVDFLFERVDCADGAP